jgi:hypothetical protein
VRPTPAQASESLSMVGDAGLPPELATLIRADLNR